MDCYAFNRSLAVSITHQLTMSTVVRQAMHGETETYFAYLSRSGQIPCAIKTLIDRYHISIYDNVAELQWVPPSDCDAEEALVNFSTNNNDDDVEPAVPSPSQVQAADTAKLSPSPTKVVKLKFPSLTRRLSKLGKRSSTDKNKTPVESTPLTSPSDSQLMETASSAETSMTTVDDLNLQSPDTCTALNDQQKSKDQDEQKDKYEEGIIVEEKT